jgi:hypothetical protein
MRVVAVAGLALAVTSILLPTASAATLGGSSVATAAKPVHYKNCAALNQKFPHGLGKPGAHDKVAKGAKPVTNFTRNLAWYNANKGRDRDKDGIACEKH